MLKNLADIFRLQPNVSSGRRFDLDWLRVFALALLIFYHIGMFYVSWDYHVKSVHAGPTGESLMKLINPWRLPLLFFISGVSIRFAFDKQSWHRFGWQRTLRLFIPIAFAIHVVVAPQSWLELLESGEIDSGFWAFYPQYLIGSISQFSIIIPTWNHMWYVVYLMIYTLVLLPFARPLASLMSGIGGRLSGKMFSGKRGVIVVMLIPVIPFLIFRLWLKPLFPSTHALIDDWANHQIYFTIFIFGFMIAKDTAFWQAVGRALKPASAMVFLIAIIASLVWYGENNNVDFSYLDPIERYSERIRKTAYAWFCILTLLGISQQWFNHSSKALTYMSEAIFSWYILHQTLIIMAGYWLTRRYLSVAVEFIALCALTIFGCLFIHECLIRRWQWIRPLFGLKMKFENQ
ncbi:MAG: acyltransferase family protein [Psychrosphaera sp.]|nr:acyltransferase family protein [Psychrosphaera sp.]